MSDIIFEGKQRKKEEFVYPSEEPGKRMKYCTDFLGAMENRERNHGKNGEVNVSEF